MATKDELLLTKLEGTRQDLLDLGLRNSLLNFRTDGARAIKVIDEIPREVFRIMVREKKAMAFLGDPELDKKAAKTNPEQAALFSFPPVAKLPTPSAKNGDVANPVDPNAPLEKRYTDLKLQTALATEILQKRLLKISYDARASIEEQGVNILYLALGMLNWFEADSSEKLRTAPLLLIPVEIIRSDVRERFQIRYTEEELGHNLSLEAKLKTDFNITLPHLPESEEFSVDGYFNEVSKAVTGQTRWQVDRRAISLGFFSFGKFLLYKDLDPQIWPQGNSPNEHQIIRGLLLGELTDRPSPVIENQSLDKQPPTLKLQTVLDADSSQMVALADIVAGRNLVIHGPPGTGKSQTITNLIAEALTNGKTVLFVAEKMAALEVVKRRLDDIGLGLACLEVHSHKTNKKAVLAELNKVINISANKPEKFEAELKLLEQTRNRLNTYSEAVNTPIGESGITPYLALGQLIQLDKEFAGVNIPKLETAGYHRWSRSEYSELKALVGELAALFQSIGTPQNHPFWGIRCRSLGIRGRQELEEALVKAIQAVERVSTLATKVTQPINLPAPTKPWEFSMTHFILNVPNVFGANVQSPLWLDQAEQIKSLLSTGATLSDLHRRYDPLFKPEAWSQPDLLNIRQTLEKYSKKLFRNFSKVYKQAQERFASLCAGPAPTDLKTRLEYLDALLQGQQLQATWNQFQGLGVHLYQSFWRDLFSDWNLLGNLTNWLQQLHSELRKGECPPGLVNLLATQPNIDWYRSDVLALQNAVSGHIQAIKVVVNLLQLDEVLRFGPSGPLVRQGFQKQIETLNYWKHHIGQAQEMVSFNDLSVRCGQLGLGAYVKAGNNWPEAGLYLEQAFEKTWLTNLLDQAYKDRPSLSSFNRQTHEQVISQFRSLDEQSLKFNRTKIAASHTRKVEEVKQTALFGGPLAPQLKLLQREIEKKQRHIPLRRLFKNAGTFIQAVKPVFMMSPLSVATFLEPGVIKFDLVIFDEASQVRPADSFGAILRGKQVVVAGDDRQLPPSSFFEKITQSGDGAVEEEDEDLIYASDSGDFESILSLFKSNSQPRMLRWHYRSLHESLIAVSNHEFYNNQLIIFPSPDANKSVTGLVYRYLPNTTYDRSKSRTNLREAEAVALVVMEHARTRPDLSLGVATFSIAQRAAVEEQLELLRRKDPTCEKFFAAHPNEPFFIKNLENVQGDERDVILISIGYGKGTDGKVTMNFGPLTTQGGERRLNVLISRARRRCAVFTNLTAEDIDLSRTQSRGVKSLKVFLDYARSGTLHSVATVSGRDLDSPFEEAVMNALVEKGYEIKPQVGQSGFFIDLAVVDPEKPGRYLLGIECDGATYHSALSARDRDRLRQKILEGLGWQIHRIWSTDWFSNPNRELERVIQAIETARAASKAKVTVTRIEGTPPVVKPAPNKPIGTVNNQDPKQAYTFDSKKGVSTETATSWPEPMKKSEPPSPNVNWPIRTCEWCNNTVLLVNDSFYYDRTPFRPHECERTNAY